MSLISHHSAKPTPRQLKEMLHQKGFQQLRRLRRRFFSLKSSANVELMGLGFPKTKPNAYSRLQRSSRTHEANSEN